MKSKLQTGLAGLRSKFMEALPIILFFLFLFYSVILIFGISHVILVSVVTILFKINYRRYMTARQLMGLVGTQFLMAFLSFLATLNLPLCILLNLTVPFLLVFLQSSQFNQLGYYTGAMCFTFLQLRPVGWQGLAMQMAALAYGLAVMTAVLYFHSRRSRKGDDFALAEKGLLLLAAELQSAAGPVPEDGKKSADSLFPILQGLYKEAYKSRGLTKVVNARGRIQYMFALLFQRSVYFLTNPYQERTLADESCRGILLRLARYMETMGKEGFQQGGSKDGRNGCSKGYRDGLSSEAFSKQGKELLAEAAGREEAPYIFVRNFLGLLLLILENLRRIDENVPSPGWKLPVYRRPVRRLFCHMRTDTFETRFALRLSVVLTAGFAYSMMSQANHGYWLALNAFLLLRPMYEDSASRMKSRFIGTMAGCLLLQLLLPLFHGTGWHFVLATVMAVGLYMETAGTWQQALFSTCFALTLTTMALPQTLAAELRFLYVVIAILMVLAANRFFFPTSLKSQFTYNLNQLLHIHQVYLRLLGRSLKMPLDYGVICDIQIHYHLVHDQIQEYLKKAGHEKEGFIREMLWISWYMVSEAEQMLYLINSRKISSMDNEQMDDYLIFTACIISDIQKRLNMRADHVPAAGESMAYRRTMEGEERLSRLMEQYSKQVSRLYLCVCRQTENANING
ncbi:FUSC family protein [Enterocloster sp. OA13]|uniref:FUSC family protein n=1 Tax=Enterocloster sp. OA13 TaxID=2914161 RepID=UPI000471F8D3|nr:FUSC family protein [Enterocloster sp. OA13]